MSLILSNGLSSTNMSLKSSNWNLGARPGLPARLIGLPGVFGDVTLALLLLPGLPPPLAEKPWLLFACLKNAALSNLWPSLSS